VIPHEDIASEQIGRPVRSGRRVVKGAAGTLDTGGSEPDSGAPLFLAREAYRRRRLIDAARLLPAFGAALVMLPILWNTGETNGGASGSTAQGMVFIFVIWAVLIVLAAVLARRLTGPLSEGRTRPPVPSSGGASGGASGGDRARLQPLTTKAEPRSAATART
jgi:hypothetical protein